jgi:membrane protease YdiL (CAAX protease family)
VADRFVIAIALAALPLAAVWAVAGPDPKSERTAQALGWLLLAALLEEIVFRGGLQTWLARRAGWTRRIAGLSLANMATSIAFAAAHLWQHGVLHAAAVLPVSLVLGISLERSGRLWVPVALHAWFNVLLFAASWWVQT